MEQDQTAIFWGIVQREFSAQHRQLLSRMFFMCAGPATLGGAEDTEEWKARHHK